MKLHPIFADNSASTTSVLCVVKSNCFVVHYLMLLQILINSVASVCTVSISRIPAALARSPGVAVPHGEVQIPRFASLVSSYLPTGRCSLATVSHWVEILIPTISWEPRARNL